MAGAIAMLAHQGGWDEALLVATPIALFVALLRIANKRAAGLAEEAGEADSTDETDPSVEDHRVPLPSQRRPPPGATAPDRGDS